MANVKIVWDNAGLFQFMRTAPGVKAELNSIASAKCAQLNTWVGSHQRSGGSGRSTYEGMRNAAFEVSVDNVSKIQGWPVAMIHPTNKAAHAIASKHQPHW